MFYICKRNLFAVEMVELLGCNSTISAANLCVLLFLPKKPGNFDCFRFLKDVYLMYKWWHCWAAMPLFVYQIFLLSFLKDWKVLYF